MAQGALAVSDRPVPLAERVGGGGQMSQRAPGPPAIAQRLERAEPALAHLDAPMQLAREDVHLRQAGLRESAQLEQATALRDRDRLRAVRDRGLRAAAGQAEEKAHPVVPGRAPGRVRVALDQRADLLQQRALLDVLTDREPHLALPEDRIDPPQ